MNLAWRRSDLMPLPPIKKAQGIALGFFLGETSSPNHHTAIGHNGLAGNVLASSAGQ